MTVNKNSHPVDSESDQEISNTNNSLYSAKAVNCQACLESKVEPCYPYKPSIKEIVNIFYSKPTTKLVRQAFQLINELVDNHEPPIDEICCEGLDIFVVQGIQFEDPFIQYYAIHALSVIIERMNEKQIRNLISQGLLISVASVLQRDMLFIIQEGIEVCSKIAMKSAALRDVIACGSLPVSELLSKYYQTISTELARIVALFLRNLCYLKPVPESILKRVVNSARHLLRYQDNEVRLASLTAIFEAICDDDLTVAFDDTYIELILVFLDSPHRAEVKIAFDIASQFAGKLNCNTDAIIKAGFIKKILSVLARYSDTEFGFQTCSFLTIILSRKKYIGLVLDSGLVFLLLGLLDEGTKTYKKEACKALKSMYNHISRNDAIKLSAPAYLERICNIITSENNDHVLCALALMNRILNACSKQEGQVENQLKLALDYIRDSEAFDYITEYINSDHYEIQRLAIEIYSVYFIDI
ncbi:Importin subunit [Dirofilaria immitis]